MLQDPTATVASGGTGITGWRTMHDDVIATPDAELALVSAPSAGEVDVASADFAIACDGNTNGDVVVTPFIVSGPGTGVFTPTTATVNSDAAIYDTFVFTPAEIGDYIIGFSNNRGLGNPAQVAYQAQSPYVPPVLDTSWVVDFNPAVDFVTSQGTVPSGSAYSGQNNRTNAQTQYAVPNTIASFALGTAASNSNGTLDADSLTRNTYETMRIITDPDDAGRKAYQLRLDPSASGWTADHKLRAQLAAVGTGRRTRPWGTRAWLVGAFRYPASMLSQPIPAQSRGWVSHGGLHTVVDDYGTGGHLQIGFTPGGATPANAQMAITVSTWNAPNWPANPGTDGADRKLLLFAGGTADPVPTDTWIYVAIDYRLWHGCPDPSPSPIPTPTGAFYVRPYVAVGTGPVLPKAPHEGVWGVPYKSGSIGWAQPTYQTNSLYTNPSSTWSVAMEIMSLGVREWIAADAEAANPGGTLTAVDYIEAFKQSREL